MVLRHLRKTSLMFRQVLATKKYLPEAMLAVHSMLSMTQINTAT